MRTIAVLPGDGIGPEVVDVVVSSLDRLGLPLRFEHGDIGWDQWCLHGDPVPEATWRLLEGTDTCLLGAVTSKPLREAETELEEAHRGRGLHYVSPVVQLRQRLDLFANVRPVTDLMAGRFSFLVVRENTEGLYSGLDVQRLRGPWWQLARDHPNAAASGPDGTSATLRLQTDRGLDRLLRFGFDLARGTGCSKVTVADKPNVLRASSDHVRRRLEAVAGDYPDVEHEVLNVDAVALWMVRSPERFGVLVAENMFGDILSDLGAGVMGGLGLASSANIGTAHSYFEPVHGSAPRLTGQNRANPMAAYLTAAQMLQHLGLGEASDGLRGAVREVVRARRRVSYDLGGTAGTRQVAAAVDAALIGEPGRRWASILAVGDELLSGEIAETNGTAISRLAVSAGFDVRSRAVVGDEVAAVRDAVEACLGRDDLVIVSGGLGPTSDDVTCEAVAAACGTSLVHDDEAARTVRERLRSFGLVPVEPLREAMRPAGGALLPNDRGSAPGTLLVHRGTDVVVVPGPPSECLPMVERALAGYPRRAARSVHRWTLLGVVEGEIAAAAEAAVERAGREARISYRWSYPYVHVGVTMADGGDIPAGLDDLMRPHTVSRCGRDAFSELRTLGPFTLEKCEVGLGGEELRTGLGATEGSGEGPRVQVRATSLPPDRPGHGEVVLDARIRVRDRQGRTIEQRFAGSFPNRGPEVADAAAAWYAWCLVRALAPDGTRTGAPRPAAVGAAR